MRDMLFLDQNLTNRKEMFESVKTVGYVKESNYELLKSMILK